MHVSCLSAILAVPLLLSSSALATPLTVTSTAVSSIALSPSSDTLSLSSGSVSPSATGDIAFQTGSFSVGTASASSQTISFSFNDTVTINGVSNIITIFGQDTTSSSGDALTILAGSPIRFGSYIFKLDAVTYTNTTAGHTLPITLSANISPVPEPASLTLLGTGVGASLLGLRARRRLSSSTLDVVEPAL